MNVPISEIIFLKAEQNYTHIYLKDSKKLTIARTLKDFEVALSDYQFYRIHRGFLVNKYHLKKSNSDSGEAILTNNHRVVASRRRKIIFDDMVN